MSLSRRRFLQAAAAGAVVWASPLRNLARATSTSVPARFTTPLPRLTELSGSSISLHATQADVAILPGVPTSLWTFNGMFPGPLIRRTTGQPFALTVHNELPPDAGPLSIHHHGGHQESVDDGQPAGAGIEPGSSRTYHYPLVEDDAPERGALQWYHDHTHRLTAERAWKGLVGLVLLADDEGDTRLGLPTGAYDVPLVVTDRTFDASNQLTDPYANPVAPPNDEVTGEVVLVNGAPAPYLDVEPRRYRFRVLNASNFRIYNLALEAGSPFVQVGTESGLLPAPITVSSVTLGPAERAEILVDLTGQSGTVNVVSVPLADTYVPRSGATPADILQLRIGALSGRDTTSVPATLRPLPAWTDQLGQVPDRVWAFSLAATPGDGTAWTVNGQAFDPARVDAKPELGATETWMFVNAGPVAVSHYVHLHDVDWKVLSRNGAAPSGPEAGLKETFRLDPGEVIVIGTRFTDHVGRYMVHCHMLDHEDHGMMTTFEVVAAGAGDRQPVPSGPDPAATRVRASMPAAIADAALAVLDRVARTKRAAPMSVLNRPLPLITTPYSCTITT